MAPANEKLGFTISPVTDFAALMHAFVERESRPCVQNASLLLLLIVGHVDVHRITSETQIRGIEPFVMSHARSASTKLITARVATTTQFQLMESANVRLVSIQTIPWWTVHHARPPVRSAGMG